MLVNARVLQVLLQRLLAIERSIAGLTVEGRRMRW
jgi:hypothetical protein